MTRKRDTYLFLLFKEISANKSSFAGIIGGTAVFGGVSTSALVGFNTSRGILYMILKFQYVDSSLNAVVDLDYHQECINLTKASGKLFSKFIICSPIGFIII